MLEKKAVLPLTSADVPPAAKTPLELDQFVERKYGILDAVDGLLVV